MPGTEQRGGGAIIPTALSIDLRAFSEGDRGEALRHGDAAVPGRAAVEYPVGEGVLAKVLPEVRDRVEFGAVWRRRHQGDVVRADGACGIVPTGAVEDELDAYCREALLERGMELIAVAGPAVQKVAAEFADGVTETIETVMAAAD